MPNITTDHRANQRGVAVGVARSTFSRLQDAALGLWVTCRSRAALAMMSERDLSDVGLLPTEVRSEFCR